MVFSKNINTWIRTRIERYRDYFLLNRTLIISIASAMFVSAIFAQVIEEQTAHVNATLTIIVSYATYYLVFGTLYYKSNKEKYISEAGNIDTTKLRKDFLKIITSVGLAEIIYLSSRWVLHYHLLDSGHEPFSASITAHAIAATLFVSAVNIGVYLTKLYKKDPHRSK